MKRPTVASLKKVTAQNLAGLGVERLAAILVDVADTRPELKRRLRMELAAEQGAEHLVLEIDKRLASLATSRSKVSWRQRPAFVRDLDALRVLIAERLAALDHRAGLARLWQFMDLSRRVGARVRDRDGELAAVFARAAADVGRQLGALDPGKAAEALVEATERSLVAWTDWLPEVLATAPPDLRVSALRQTLALHQGEAAWGQAIRLLADAAGDPDAYRATFREQALRQPSVAADVGARLLKAGRVDEAGRLLEAAAGQARPAGRFGRGAVMPEVDFDWESAWLDYLERSGRGDEAQAARWASFERTLSVERARDFTRGLAEFEDVEAETRAFEIARKHPDAESALRFLMEWPALIDAGRLVEERSSEIDLEPDLAEAYAAKLRGRRPEAAQILLRKAAALAYRRRDRTTAERLIQEADVLSAKAQQ